MSSDLESLMRDVARAVEGDARRRQLLPEIQARLGRLDDQSRQARRAHGTLAAVAGGRGAVRGRRSRSSCCGPHALSYAVDGAARRRTARRRRALVAPRSRRRWRCVSRTARQVTLPPRAQAHVDALDAHGATVALEDGTRRGLGRPPRAHALGDPRRRLPHPGDRHALRGGLGSPHRSLTVHDARGFGAGHRAGPEGAGAGGDRPAAARERRQCRQAGRRADGGGRGRDPGCGRSDAGRGPTGRAGRCPRSGAGARACRGRGQAGCGRPSRPRSRAASGRDDVEARARRRRVAHRWRRAADSRKRSRPQSATDSTSGCLRLPAEDVAKLGETARLAGDVKRAEYAYQAANRRFPSATPHQALFGLGKIAFDQHRDYASAAKWFGRYVQRFPQGPLVREAAGLLLVSRIKAGDNAGARAAAESYLQRFQDGPHAKLARDTRGY